MTAQVTVHTREMHGENIRAGMATACCNLGIVAFDKGNYSRARAKRTIAAVLCIIARC